MTADHLDALVALVRRCDVERHASLSCPACGAAGLAIEDQSTRPVALWYAVSCGKCGLAETIQIPLGVALNSE